MADNEQNDEENQQQTGLGARLSGRLNRGRQAVRQGIERADGALSESAERAGVSEQLDSARQTLQRSGEVFTGADIRQFDAFTDAVTRVVLGLHNDQADMARRLTQLEQSIDEVREIQTKLAKQVASIERMITSQSVRDSE